MSPNMYSLNRSECGRVDLFYNDLWGLKSTIDVIEQWIMTEPKSTRNILGAVSCADDFQGNAVVDPIRILSKRLYSASDDRTPLDTATLDLFGSYFRELNEEVVNQDYHIKFMVRSIGLTAELIPYLEQRQTASEEVERLLWRLQSEENEHSYSLMRVEESEEIGLIERYYERCFRKLSQEDGASQEEVLLACELALDFVGRLQMIGLLEKALQILMDIEKHLPEECRRGHSVLMFNNAVFLGDATFGDIDKLCEGAGWDASD